MCTIMSRGGAVTFWGRELPKGVAYLIKDVNDRDWKEVTYKEINARRKAKQDSNIYAKRRHEEVHHCAVWVFYNNPLWSTFFGGWFIYVRTLKGDFALNWRCIKKDLIAQVKSLFPCGCLPFDDYDTVWFNAFEKQYHYPGKREKNAIAFAKCRFDERGNIKEIFL